MANYVKLVALVVTLMVSMDTVRGQTTAAPPPIHACQTPNEAVCGNCLTPVFCGDAPATADDRITIVSEVPCTSGLVCEIQYGTPTCVAISSSTTCQCNEPSQCDAHNPNAVFVCGSSGPIAVQQCGADKTCKKNKCVDDAEAIGAKICEASGVVTGWNLIKPDCKSAAYCVGDDYKGSFDCSSGEYFDPVATSCAAAPPGLCGDSCSGACPDLTNCASYDVCDGNGNSVHSMACPTDQLFDPERRRCVPEADHAAIDPAPGCAALTDCEFPPPLPALAYLNRRYAAKLL